jgi:hypothetical protein
MSDACLTQIAPTTHILVADILDDLFRPHMVHFLLMEQPFCTFSLRQEPKPTVLSRITVVVSRIALFVVASILISTSQTSKVEPNILAF